VSASRLTTGNHPLFQQLEKALEAFFHAEAALLVTAGYFGNSVATQALAGEFDHALMDQRSHPALSDAARFLGCPVTTFAHRDPTSLETAIKGIPKRQRLILLTDGMFSHNGTVAPLKEYLKALPSSALILVDDAHGAGVVGLTGRGTLEASGVGRERIIQTGTLSKAFGTGGGFVLGTRGLRQKIMQRSGMFVGCTPVPLPIAAAALQSIRILSRGGKLRRRLMANAEEVRRPLAATPWATQSGPGPIIPVLPRNSAESDDLKKLLKGAHVYPPFIHYPGGPSSGYFRFVISSEHSARQIADLCAVLQGFVKRWA
jgi:7-keto-8-aminopelargonate synthetase-like enzyme